MIEGTALRVDASDPSTARMRLVVARVETLARDCRLIELRSPGGAPLPEGQPGAHIGIHLPNGIQRQYSLMTAPSAPRSYTFAVKKDAASRGGSAFIVDRMSVGDVIEVDPPRNNFPLVTAAPLSVFFAGGIGITPIWAMIQRLEQLGRPWILHYASRSRAEAPLLNELGAFEQAHCHFDDEAGAVLPIAEILRAIPKNAHVYCCGPAPMLAAFEDAAKGRHPTSIHVEYFTPKHEASVAGGFVVELAKTGIEVEVPAGETIMQAVRACGIEVPSSCEEGICGACETRVLSGVPDHRDTILSPREREENKSMFICCSGSKSARLVLDI